MPEGVDLEAQRDQLSVTAYVFAHDPEVEVKLSQLDKRVEVTIGNDRHGDVAHLAFSDAKTLRTLAEELLACSLRLAAIKQERWD